ncbi:MAG: anthranilate phosphoribosyltransferase [Planctomycetaceae bacterium]|nr:anthranilate phosphoribosyltransferase [Planctomycetaceae bacterium]
MNHTLLGRVSAGEDLAQEEMADVIDAIMRGEWPAEEIGLLLTALRAKGESVAEVAGAASAMRKHMTPIRSERENLVDTCGTGGDGSGTFNISTAAALVTAAAGVPVAKHGNRKISSQTGSADVLSALGVNVEASVSSVERCLEEVGIGFCFAPQLHPAMKHVAAVRRKLAVPTIFNLLGPLSNPASAGFQLLGVGRGELRSLLAAALSKLGTQRAVVVCGADGLDEVTLAAQTHVTLVEGIHQQEHSWKPSDFGFHLQELDAIQAANPESSAAVIRSVLQGEPGPAREITVMNAAAAIWTTRVSENLEQAARRAEQAIDNGSALDVLDRLARTSQL